MKDITDELERKGKSAGLDCFYEELWHQGEMVATWGYNGVHIFDRNYTYQELPGRDEKTKIVRFFQGNVIESQVPL